jgi:hypothetical protein
MAGIIVNFQSSKSAVAQEGFESFKYFFLFIVVVEIIIKYQLIVSFLLLLA